MPRGELRADRGQRGVSEEMLRRIFKVYGMEHDESLPVIKIVFKAIEGLHGGK